MNRTPTDSVAFSIATLLLCCIGLPVLGEGESPRVRGAISGRVLDRHTQIPLANIEIEARLLSNGERFVTTTNSEGVYLLAELAAGTYGFRLFDGGQSYELSDPIDARLGMPFMMQSCFELDTQASQAMLTTGDCRTPFVPEERIVSLGPHRFLVPEPAIVAYDLPTQTPEAPLNIDHEPLECVPNDEFPLIGARIEPISNVQLARLYFRAGQHTDLYFVEMALSEEGYEAVLPRASEETEEIVYYIETLDVDFDAVRTEEYVADVSTADSCSKRGPVAWFTGGDPGIIVNTLVPGAPAVPAGFEAAGITGFVSSMGVLTTAAGSGGAIGGGLGATGLVIVVASAAGGGTVIVSATGDAEGSSPVPP